MPNIGGAGFQGRRFGASPTTGTLLTVAPVPPWTQSTAYNLDPTDGISRVRNVGNLYQCRVDGTSASSGTGPTGTSNSIVDGTTIWEFLGVAPSTNLGSGSQVIASLVRGNQASVSQIEPSDTTGGAYTTIANVPYSSFPASFAGVFRRNAASSAQTDFSTFADWGDTGGGGDGDEMNITWVELTGVTTGAPHAFSVQEVPAVVTILTAPAITTSVSCVILSYWFGTGSVDAPGTSHIAIPLNGLTIVPGPTSLMATSDGYVQQAVGTRIAAPGTFSEQWQTTGEAAILVTVAYALISEVLGTLSVTLQGSTLSSTGQVLVQGSASQTLAATTVSSTGQVLVQGAASSTLAASTISSTGQILVQGSAAQTLAAATVSSAGQALVQGAAAQTLAPSTVSSTGQILVQGISASTLSATTVVSVGNVPIAGTSSTTLAPTTVSSAGQVLIQGLAAATLIPASVSSAGQVSIAGTSALTLQPTSLVSTGVVSGGPGVEVTGELTATLAPATLVAKGTVPVTFASIPEDLLENLGGAPYEVHPRIPGPLPRDRFQYFIVPPKYKTRFVLYMVESALIYNGSAERVDLVNGARIYRVLFHSLWRIAADRNGPFISLPLGPKQESIKIRFTVDDPTLGQALASEWAGLG